MTKDDAIKAIEGWQHNSAKGWDAHSNFQGWPLVFRGSDRCQINARYAKALDMQIMRVFLWIYARIEELKDLRTEASAEIKQIYERCRKRMVRKGKA